MQCHRSLWDGSQPLYEPTPSPSVASCESLKPFWASVSPSERTVVVYVPHWAGGTVLCSVHSVLRVLHLTTGVQDTAAAPEAAAARTTHDLLQVARGAPETRISCQGHGPLRGAEAPLLIEARRQQRQDQPDDPAPSGSADTAATGSVTDPR